MVKGTNNKFSKKNYYYRRYKYRIYKNLKWRKTNLLNLKVEYSDILTHPTEDQGRIIYYNRRESGFPHSMTLLDIFTNWGPWQNLYDQWEYILIRGVKITTVPQGHNFNPAIASNTVMIGVFFGDTEDKTYEQLQDNNTSYIVENHIAMTRYYGNPDKKWLSLQDFGGDDGSPLKGQIWASSVYPSSYANGYAFSIRITMYITVKKSKI